MASPTDTSIKTRGDSTVDPRDNKRGTAVRDMFAGIAGRYDLLNRIISGGRDQAWRRRTVRMAGLKGGERVLDICCGTGDLGLMFAFADPSPAQVIASDFTREMLAIAQQKATNSPVRKDRVAASMKLCQADALRLPFADATFDVVSVGYGVRNFQDLDAGLREMARVLKPGGRTVILEATPARGVIGRFANWYINRVVPWVGNRLTRSSHKAYSYLADSIQLFPDAESLKQRMEAAGFGNVGYHKLNLRTMAIHVGERLIRRGSSQ
jgi:demethylmenaquinone methyltransferase/2-methoxy-6-polyprenyl-1,4-benzoquinol methylase